MTDLDEFARDRPASTAAEPTPLGTLTVREGLRLTEDRDGDRLEAYITPERREAVRLGSYVVVPLPTPGDAEPEALFCRVEAIQYRHEFATDDATAVHSRRAMAREGVDERDFKYIASLTPLTTVIGDPAGEETLNRRQPDTLPKPDTTVREALYDAEIKAGLKLPREGIFVGHLAVGGELVTTAAEPPTVDYRLRDASVADPLVFRHVVVAGGTGSGKTHAAKNLLRQLVAGDRRYPMPDGRNARPAVLVVDPQDEYAQLRDDNPELTEEDRRRLRREDIAFDGVEDTFAFVPIADGSRYAPTDHRAEIVRFTVPFSMVRTAPWLIAGGRMNDRQYNALDDLLEAYFREERGAPTYAAFLDFVEGDPAAEALVADGRIHEETFDAVRRRVDRPYFRRTFDRDAPAITSLVDRFVRPGGITTVPTYHLESSAQRLLVVLAVTSLVVDEKLTSDPYHDRIAETPIVLAMDEAHNYLSDARSVQARRTVRTFTEAAKQGRKERLGLFLVTQDPGDIADPIFKQVNTRIALNLTDDDAIDSLNLDRTLASQVPDLETGRMVVHSPDNAEPVQVVGLPRCVVKHAPR